MNKKHLGLLAILGLVAPLSCCAVGESSDGGEGGSLLWSKWAEENVPELLRKLRECCDEVGRQIDTLRNDDMYNSVGSGFYGKSRLISTTQLVLGHAERAAVIRRVICLKYVQEVLIKVIPQSLCSTLERHANDLVVDHADLLQGSTWPLMNCTVDLQGVTNLLQDWHDAELLEYSE